jgi:hypothetical protein
MLANVTVSIAASQIEDVDHQTGNKWPITLILTRQQTNPIIAMALYPYSPSIF